jgi:hypothetical protein
MSKFFASSNRKFLLNMEHFLALRIRYRNEGQCFVSRWHVTPNEAGWGKSVIPLDADTTKELVAKLSSAHSQMSSQVRMFQDGQTTLLLSLPNVLFMTQTSDGYNIALRDFDVTSNPSKSSILAAIDVNETIGGQIFDALSA